MSRIRRVARALPALAVVAGPLALAGCSDRILVSEPQSAAAAGGQGERGGLVYSLPMTLLTIEGQKDATSGKVTYTPTASILPDPAARYRLRYVAGGATDDDFEVKVNNAGLLTNGDATVTDQSRAIILSLAKTAALIAGATGKAPTPKEDKDIYPFKVILDLETLLEGVELPDGSRIVARKDPLTRRAPAFPAGVGPAPACEFSLCYRAPVSVVATITGARGSAEFAFLALDPTHTEWIDIKSAALVTRVAKVTFENGVLTSNKVTQTSTLKELANLPLDIVKAVLSAPSELLTIRTTTVGDQKALIDAKAGLLTQQKALLDADKALRDARAAAAGAPTPAVTGTGTSP